MILDLLQDAWDIAEPIVGFTAVFIAIWYWTNTKIAKSKKYINKNSKKYIIALQVGRPVSEAVKNHFGEVDTIIDTKSLLLKDTIENDKDYRLIVKEIYKALAQNQDSEIHLVLSGPVALNFLVGQMVGLSHFDLNLYQYNPINKEYQKISVPNRSWLNY